MKKNRNSPCGEWGTDLGNRGSPGHTEVHLTLETLTVPVSVYMQFDTEGGILDREFLRQLGNLPQNSQDYSQNAV